MRIRKSPIAKNLVNNSIAGMFSAIEIHNKPTIKYRYEMVVLLVLNAWELLLKGYLYKYHKDIKLFHKDGTTKPFDNCVNSVNLKIGKDFNPILENLNVLYGYRNQVAHFYIEELDPVMFSLISKSIIFYSEFLKKHFAYDLSAESDLVLLPIGFKRPISPIDYISTTSVNQNASTEVKAFLQTIIDATQRLNSKNICDTIFVDFRMNLTNVNRITNADLIAGIDNSKSNELTFSVNKEPRKIVISNEGEKVRMTKSPDESEGIIYLEELQEGIFDEINNILDANKLLAVGKQQFVLGESLYYRIYSERQHVSFNIETYDLLARTGSMNFYGPFLYWLIKLPVTNIVDILFNIFEQYKSPNINNLTKIALLLGGEALMEINLMFEKKHQNKMQKPESYYTFQSQQKKLNANPLLTALKTSNSKLIIDTFNFESLYNDTKTTSKILSVECLKFFKGEEKNKKTIRDLDFLAYYAMLVDNGQINEAIKRRK